MYINIMDNEDTPQTTLKQKKPRSEAQIASLEKARVKAMEMRAERFKNVNENEELQSEPEDEPTPEPAAEKPKKPRKPRTIKPKAEPVESKPEPEPEPEPELEREPEEVKQFRKEIQEAPSRPPTPKQHFKLMHSFKKSYMLFHE